MATTSSANWVAMHFKVGLDLLFYPTIIFFLRRQLPFYTMHCNVDENNLEYDLLKVNVFYNSLLEKTVTDKKDYDLKVRSM